MDRERERQIVIKARALGKSDDFIKQAIIRDRERRASNTPVQPTEQPATGVAGFGVGLLKGLGSTVKGLGTIGTKIGAGVTAALDPNRTYSDVMKGGYGLDVLNPETEAGQRAEETLRAKTTSQKIGKGIEQIAEFFIPAGKLAMADKAIDAAITASKLSKGAKTVAKVASYAGLEGASAGGITLAQTGGDFKEAGKATLTAGIAAPVLRGVSNVISGITSKWPSNYVRKIAPRLNKDATKLKLTPEETLKRYKFGSLKSNIDREITNASNQSKAIKETLKSTGYADKIFNKNTILGGLQKELPNLPLSSAKDMDKIFARLKTSLPNESNLITKLKNNTLTINEADDLAGKLYSYAKSGDVLTGGNATLANKTAFLIRNFIKTNVPKTKPFYEDWAKSIEFIKALSPALKKSASAQLTGNDLLRMGAAGFFGGPGLAAAEGFASATRFMPGVGLSTQKVLGGNKLQKVGGVVKPIFEKGVTGSIVTSSR